MKLIQPSVEFLGEVPTDYQGNLEWIERAGRLCYKSESKGEPEKFVKKLIASGHLAMVEHSNFVVRAEYLWEYEVIKDIGKFLSLYIDVADGRMYVGGNLTAWYNRYRENNAADVFCPFEEVYHKLFGTPRFSGREKTWQLCPHNEIPKQLRRYTVKFICNRAVSHELVRHRPCSFAQESQRYVRYDGGMEFIEPLGFDEWSDYAKIIFSSACFGAEEDYRDMRNEGLSPQQARAVLPNATKTEIIVTADAAEWAHIKKLRTAKDADPEMQMVMNRVPWEEICG